MIETLIWQSLFFLRPFHPFPSTVFRMVSALCSGAAMFWLTGWISCCLNIDGDDGPKLHEGHKDWARSLAAIKKDTLNGPVNDLQFPKIGI